MTTYKRIDGDYVITTLNPTDTIDVNTSEVTVSGNLIALGNVQSNIAIANFFLGDGQFLTNVVANTGTASTGNIYANIVVANTFNGINLSVSGNITGNNIYGNNIYANGSPVLNGNSVLEGGSYSG
jgi:hypothetical protein